MSLILKIENWSLFGSCFLILFLKTVSENIENTILMFSKNYFFSLNIVFFVFFFYFMFFYVFQNKTKLGTKRVLSVFYVLLVENRKQFSKTENKQALVFCFLLSKLITLFWDKMYKCPRGFDVYPILPCNIFFSNIPLTFTTYDTSHIPLQLEKVTNV